VHKNIGERGHWLAASGAWSDLVGVGGVTPSHWATTKAWGVDPGNF